MNWGGGSCYVIFMLYRKTQYKQVNRTRNVIERYDRENNEANMNTINNKSKL